jgi:hypothetical protein
MAKPKAKTLIEKHGFSDPELITSKHDEIMLWLDLAIDKMLPIWLGYNDKWTEKEVGNAYAVYKKSKYYSPSDELDFPNKPSLKIVKKRWEHAITAERGSKYVVGFIDMVVCYQMPTIYFERWDAPIVEYGEGAEGMVNFEVKTKLNSIGEILRQVHYYKEFVRGEWFVVAPNVGMDMKNVLHDQGIGFVEYDPDLLKGEAVELPNGKVAIVFPWNKVEYS